MSKCDAVQDVMMPFGDWRGEEILSDVSARTLSQRQAPFDVTFFQAFATQHHLLVIV
jgi:hypothetical protein